MRAAAILLVEDDPEVAEMFSLGLSISGHNVVIADDGGSAVELARRRRCNLILLDVRLPRIDGLTALSRLRSSSSTRALPVVMLTNSNDVALRRRVHSLGKTQWVVKSETRPPEPGRRVSFWFANRLRPRA